MNLNIEYISLVIYNENIWDVNINECPIFRNVSFELINTLKINVFLKWKVKDVQKQNVYYNVRKAVLIVDYNWLVG